MVASSFGSLAVYFFYLVILGELKNHGAFFRQIFPVIGKSSRGFDLFIKGSNFAFVGGEADSAIIQFEP